MGRRLTWVFAVLIAILGACDDTADQTTTTSDANSTGSSEEPVPTDSGRLAVLDSSGNIVVLDPDGSNRLVVTEDAGEGALYAQPVWSPDATTLAWGQATGSGFAVGITTPGGDTGTTVIPTANLPFYTYWSPSGGDLGVLHNGTSGVSFQMIDVEAGTNSHLDEDAPFYFSWSPAGDRVVTHAGVSRAETLTPDGERVQLEPTAGTFLAPQWTDAGVFHVIGDRLVLEDEDGDRDAVAAVSGLTMFVANSQGTLVAVQTTGDGSPVTASTDEPPTVISDRVVMVDVGSGDIETVDETLALGFFWSPNGRSLLVLTTSENRVVPKVWTSDGQTHQFAPYQPPAQMLQDTFPFFPQYAQSVSFWAPDSSAFALAGAVDGESGIWVQRLDEETPSRVSDGVWVAWSPPRP